MSVTRQTALVASIKRHEALRLVVYDDATGLPIRQGSVVEGHPTIGYGRALDVHGISEPEAGSLLVEDVLPIDAELAAALPWYISLDDVRSRVLSEMVFQMGFKGLLGFHHTLSYVSQADYANAATCMRASYWYKKTPGRAEKLCKMMETGKDPS